PTAQLPGAPLTPRERVLAQIFADVLGVDHVGPHDSFFELGGHSMLAVPLVTQIRMSLGADISIRAVFEAPTVAELTRRLDGAGQHGDALARVLPLRTGTGGPAQPGLFCVHPLTGLSWCYTSLIRAVGPGRPLHGIQARGLAGPGPSGPSQALPQSVAEMAREYAGQILAVQPCGPYDLLGWSFGGTVAHAVAVRLRELGHQVGLLALLDSWPAGDSPPAEEMPLRHVLQEAFDVDPGTDPDGTGPDGTGLTPARALRILRAPGSLLASLQKETVAALLGVACNNARLMSAHRPDRFDGAAVYFTAAGGDPASIADPIGLWGPFIEGGLECHRVNCTHQQMMRAAPATHIAQVVRTKLAGSGGPDTVRARTQQFTRGDNTSGEEF
ncbi:MAG: thioesterase domain-containing protein, partial [Streptosporangiaceae bacterium]